MKNERSLLMDLLLVVMGMLCFGSGQAQITVDPLPPTTLCSSTTVNVPFTAIGSFVVGNVFTLELSDASGSFAAPQVLGTLMGVNSGTISGTIPAGTNGTGFRLRVNSSMPVMTGADNGSDLSIEAPNAGIDGFGTICGGNAYAAPFLGGTPDPGGVWSIVAGIGVWVMDDHFVGMSDGEVVGYTVTTPNGCSAMATVTFSFTIPPFAGTGGAIALCSSGAPINLFPLLGGSPSAGGTWTAPNGAQVPNGFQPGVSIPGCYTYTVIGDPPCPNASSQICVAVNQAPNSGTNAAITLCSNAAPISLLNGLGGTPDVGGTWTYLSMPWNGIFDPAVDAAGCYTYTTVGSAPCANATSTVCITVVQSASAGADVAFNVCSTDAPSLLFNVLGGTPQPGGTWLDPTLVPMNGVFIPGTSVPGCYQYVVTGSAPCGNDTAMVCATVSNPPSAGANGSVVWCQSLGVVDVSSYLGGAPMPGGTWVDVNATGQLTGSLFNASGMPAGSYPFIYTVTAAPCMPASATVTVAVGACLTTPQNTNPVE